MIEKINLQLADFDTEDDRTKAIMDLTAGLKSPFWFWFEKVIQMNIETTQDELFDNEELTKEENNLIKKYLRTLKQLKELPHKQLSILNCVENINEEDDPDPYSK